MSRTFEEAIEMLVDREKTEARREVLIQTYEKNLEPVLRAAESAEVAGLVRSMILQVATGSASLGQSYLMAFQAGLQVGLLMREESNDNQAKAEKR